MKYVWRPDFAYCAHNRLAFGEEQALPARGNSAVVYLRGSRRCRGMERHCGLRSHQVGLAAAVAFLEWLSAKKAQQIFADVNLEYPVNPDVPVNPIVASWGSFKQNKINLKNAGENQAAAIQLMDRVGYK